MEAHNLSMRRTDLSTFLIVAILACMGVAAPGKAEELKHPIELGKECKASFGHFLNWRTHYKSFADAYDAKGSYVCSKAVGGQTARQIM